MKLWTDSSSPMPGMRPSVEDMLIAYATVPGYVSYRAPIGSLYVQTLCKVIFKSYNSAVNFNAGIDTGIHGTCPLHGTQRHAGPSWCPTW